MAEPMRGELRVVDGEPVMWVCLDDVLDWLASLPGKTQHQAAGQAALEIRGMLIESVSNADWFQGDG
jgi:hypothetical protein